MANAQWPVDGLPGKAWKVTSPFGWRTHPISKVKKHHNGVDIWQAKEPTWLEACFDGKVINVIEKNDNASGGNQVVVQSVSMGKKITWIYMHMVHKSIQVKKGQKITAGQVIGKMGETGFATGKHLHWEIWTGWRTAQPNINSGGVGFYDPMAFMKSAIEADKVHTAAPVATPETAPVSVMPAHSVETPVTPLAPVKVTTAPVVAKKASAVALPLLKQGSKGQAVILLQKKLGLTADGVFGAGTKAAVIAFQKKNKLTADGVVGEQTWVKLK